MNRPFSIDHFDHIVLKVRDLEKAVAFYEKILGGEIVISRSDEVSIEMSTHMRVTLMLMPDYVAPAISSVDHMNFAVNAENDDIDAVAAYMRAHDIPIVEEHEPHTSPTIRVLDPDDNVVEIRLAGPDAALLQEGSVQARAFWGQEPRGRGAYRVSE